MTDLSTALHHARATNDFTSLLAMIPYARFMGFLVDIVDGDLRVTMPRFMGDAHAANQRVLAAYNAIAADAGCTPAQLALAWLLHKAPHIVPIPGTTSVAHLQEDLAAADIRLGAETLQRLEATVNRHTVAGSRYAAQATGEVDTETF